MKPAGLFLFVASLLVSAAAADDLVSGDARLTPGKGRVLWERVGVRDAVYSDFAEPEKGNLLVTQASLPALTAKAAELAAKVKALDADAPCTLTRGKSRLGDETVTLENGLVKVVIVPRYGGRIIEISNKATGANIFVDNYQNAAAPPEADVNPRTKKESAPNLLGGWIESVDDANQTYWNTPHKVVTIQEERDQAGGKVTAARVRTVGTVTNSTWGVDGTVTVERTVRIRSGSVLVRLHVKLINHSGPREREMRFRPMVRHALGPDASSDECWVSSLGYVTRFPKDFLGDCYVSLRVEEKLDTWQGIVDREAREGVVVLPGGEIAGRMDIFGLGQGKDHWYTYENTSTLREHVVEDVAIEVDHDYAPVLNFDAVTFASDLLAVEFVPEKLHFAPGERVKALVGAAWLSTFGKGRVTLTPTFARQKAVVARGKPIEVDAALLTADPRLVTFDVPDALEPGPCDLEMEAAWGRNKVGTSRYRAFISEKSGVFLTALQPADDGYGKGLSVTGKLTSAEVVVEKSEAGESSGTYRLGEASLPWQTKIAPGGAGAFRVEHTVDFTNFPRETLLASFGMAFPCRLGTDVSRLEVSRAERLCHEYQKMLRVTVGTSGGRDEQWLVDQARGTADQEYQTPPIPYWALSDAADRLPVWRFGGVLQSDPTTAWVWKSSNYDSSPMPMVQEESAAGWVDAWSLLTKQGVLVRMPDMARNAPREIIFDGEQGAFYVYFFPPHVPALSLKTAGTRGTGRAREWGLGPDGKARFVFHVLFHDHDLTGHLPDRDNVAGEIRKVVQGMGP